MTPADEFTEVRPAIHYRLVTHERPASEHEHVVVCPDCGRWLPVTFRRTWTCDCGREWRFRLCVERSG